jgi:hypothetical protein
MATSNTAVDISELDFDAIKQKLKNYLQTQPTFTDYNFEGSALSTLLNVLSYNTHYNAYYLNMIANEMFLDTAVKRSSVVSHAKTLNYTPVSAICSKAIVNIIFSGVTSTTLTIPQNTIFYSDALNSSNYPFVTTQNITSTVVANTATFNLVQLNQGQPLSYSYTAYLTNNPKCIFKIPDLNIDTSTLKVFVRDLNTSTTFTTYTLSQNHLTLDPTTLVYFLQEATDGYYELYFGNGSLGKQLVTGNVITITYLSTKASLTNGISTFTLMSNLGSYSGVNITTISSAVGGLEKESTDSIKFNAPKAYSSHGRAVTKDDYVNIIKNSTSIVPIESVSVWGGDEEVPPILGKMFIAIKPTGGYTITQSQKDRLLNEVIKPISVITVIPQIVDINYTYLRVNSNILFNKSNSIITSDYLTQLTKSVIINFTNTTLNKFNSTFVLPDLIYAIRKIDSSIISVDANILTEKYLIPTLGINNTYNLKFGFPLKRDFLNGSIESSPFSTFVVSLNAIVSDVKIEGTPTILNSISSIDIKFPGSGYVTTPSIIILGDGTGATATATVINGILSFITVTNPGINYTQVIVKISGGGGGGAAAIPNLSGNIINLRTYYYSNGVKTILSDNIGSLNFDTGEVSILQFNPTSLNDPLGIFAITVKPDTSIITSKRDSIVTLNEFNPLSISTTISLA